MNARIIAFVACRLLALYLLLNYALVALVQLVQAIFLAAQGGPTPDIAIYSLTFAAYLGAGFGAWLGAGRISDRLIGSKPDISKPYPGPYPGIDGWQALGVALVGGLFLLTAVKYLGAWIIIAAKNSDEPGLDQITVLRAITGFYFIAGTLLLAFARNIVDGIRALRTWGHKPFFSEDTE